MQTSERSLIETAVNGSPKAFDAIFLLHHDYLFNLMSQLTGDPARADDLSQEAMIIAYRKLRHFRFESSFRTWLTRIAINLFRKGCRRLKHESLNTEMVLVPAGDRGPERLVEKSELQWCIRHNLQHHVPEKFRIVLVLRDIHNLSYKEIAEITGTNVGQVKTNLHRARRIFRELFIDHKCRAFANDYMCICEGILEL